MDYIQLDLQIEQKSIECYPQRYIIKESLFQYDPISYDQFMHQLVNTTCGNFHNFPNLNDIPLFSIIINYVSMRKICIQLFYIILFALFVLQSTSRDSPLNENDLEYDAEVSPTQAKKAYQFDQYHEGASQIDKRNQGSAQFSFELSKPSEQFYLHLSQDNNITLIIQVYVLKDDSYEQIQDIAKQPPLRVYIYENNNKVIVNKAFYFYGTLTFAGKKDSNYMIRFYSTSINKAVSVEHTKVVDTSLFVDKLKEASISEHSQKISGLKNKFTRLENQIKKYHRIFEFNQKSLIAKINSFTIFEVIEVLVVVGVCFLEIRLIKRLFHYKEII